MGVEPDDRFEQKARDDAASLGWSYEKLQGDMSLIQALLDGRWDDGRFLTVPPGLQLTGLVPQAGTCSVALAHCDLGRLDAGGATQVRVELTGLTASRRPSHRGRSGW